MPAGLTELTEIATALGMLCQHREDALNQQPHELLNVSRDVWNRMRELATTPRHHAAFVAAFENGSAFLRASDALRGRVPLRVEWKGPHRPPGDDVVPADLRVDHVYLVSCKYLSKVLLNPGPPRLFDRLLTGDERSHLNWFAEVAPLEFRLLYDAARRHTGLHGLPVDPNDLSRDQQRALRSALDNRSWPEALRGTWSALSDAVARRSASRWQRAMATPKDQLRLLWRMLRITTASYYVLGTDSTAQLRLRVDSAWDWLQSYELRALEVRHRDAGQPEVAWHATVRRRATGVELPIDGHVEIRWSHGRFNGSPEAKVYLDTPLLLVPGYNALA
jgi:hypothetical protein